VKGIVVARPSRRPCLVCALPTEKRQEVNAAIWDGKQRRLRYRAAGKRVYEAITRERIEVKSITRHAEHIEAAWREATPDDPMSGREQPVFATDYESLTERAALAGAHAMNQLEARVLDGSLGDRELLGVAKMGLGARQQQRQLENDSKRPQIMLTAIFGMASGHIRELPEAEAHEVFDESQLKEAVQAERLLLTERARGASE
jgi:hypothetical protein